MLDELIKKIKQDLVTVTLNPVIDKTLWVKEFTPGKTFLVDRSETVAGGKGVNVSRALLNFGITSLATGILCNEGKEIYLNLLKKDRIRNDFIEAPGSLRTNVTIVSKQKEIETHLRERGPLIDPDVLNDLEKKIKTLNKENSFFVFSGSLPSGLPIDSYYRLITAVKNLGTLAFLDSSGDALKEGLKAKPYFIKPNTFEVKDCLGFIPESRDDFLRAFDTFHDMGIPFVMISRGRQGILLSSGKAIVRARLEIQNPINTVGSGDASLAGGLIGIGAQLNSEDTARLACSMGGANTLVSGACIFNMEDVLDLYYKVEIDYL